MEFLSQELMIKVALIVLSVGVVVWVVRQILPARIEEARVWKVALRVVPVFIGLGVALIPGLRPFDDLAMSGATGFVAGSFASTVYGIVRSMVPGKIKALMGSRAQRNSIPPRERP